MAKPSSNAYRSVSSRYSCSYYAQAGSLPIQASELVALHHSLALFVLVLRNAKAKQQLITFDQVISQSELTTIANKLNVNYSGLTSSEIQVKSSRLSPAEQQVTDCLLKVMKAEDEHKYEKPYLDGLHFILNQPEFTHGHRMLSLMELVERRDLLKSIVPAGLTNQGVLVVIGKENESEIIQDYSLVLSRYGLPDEAEGTIAVVGPTRMPYSRSIAAIDYLAWLLSRMIARLYGKETPFRTDLEKS